ncbi:MAG TPA: GNAT family N-acetyltransferase [Candidatus Acidoferrum sp.]
MSNDLTMQGTRRTLQDFRGDYPALADLVQCSWAENSQQGLCYSPEFLQSFLTSPGSSPSLAPALYQDDKLIGFASGFTRNVEYRAHRLRLFTSSFLSVLPEFKKYGYGIVLWNELVKRARVAGFHGMLNFCVEGEPMNRMVEGASRRLKLPVQRIFSVRYMSALLKPHTAAPVCAVSPEAINDFLDLTAPLLSSQPLARQWTQEEAEWQCLRRTAAVCAHARHDSRRGILTGYVTSILDRDRTKCLIVEDILWSDLYPDERLTLLRQLLAQASALGAKMATVPVLGYADLAPFKKARFFPTRRILHCYLVLFEENIPLETLPSMYVDVF